MSLATYPGSLGDTLCANTTVCQDAETAIQQMDTTFQGLDSVTQANYQSSHDSIMSQYQANYSFYTNYIPFNPTCCTLQTLGQQAFDLMNNMLTAAGQTPVSGLQAGTGTSFTTIIVVAALALFAISYAGSHA